jgi:hypothetical protein
VYVCSHLSYFEGELEEQEDEIEERFNDDIEG